MLLAIYYSQITILLKNTLISIEKLNSRQLYSLLVYTHPFTPTSQKYFMQLFKTYSFDWKQICPLPRLETDLSPTTSSTTVIIVPFNIKS